jgi:hypothetical protein
MRLYGSSVCNATRRERLAKHFEIALHWNRFLDSVS